MKSNMGSSASSVDGVTQTFLHLIWNAQPVIAYTGLELHISEKVAQQL